jgi:prolyl oligopeptidase
MPKLMEPAPHSPTEVVTDFLHGVPVADPYRWLEDQDSPRTRAWIAEQTRYAHAYLDAIPGRDLIRRRIREFLAVETFDSLQKSGDRYFFRKRLPDQEQPCIYMRDGLNGPDQLLLDPAKRGTGPHTAVKPFHVSPDARFLMYEVKEGGERTGTYELLEIETRKQLPDVLPRGYLRGFAFAPNGKSFYHSHEPLSAHRPFYRAAYEHVLGTAPTEDREIFFAGEDERLRLALFSEGQFLVFLVYRFLERTLTDIYLKPVHEDAPPIPIAREMECSIGVHIVDDRVFAITDRNAPNRRIVEIRIRNSGDHEWIDIIPERDLPINNWAVAGDRIFVSYVEPTNHRVFVFNLFGQMIEEVPNPRNETVRIVGASPDKSDLLLETESFTQPIRILNYSSETSELTVWTERDVPFDPAQFSQSRVSYLSKDGTQIPMFLVAHRDFAESASRPTIMTSYGGFGVPMTPQFSVFVAFLIERGCLFALPSIRGGSEFGTQWHNAARRRNRQTAFDDFLSAAEWLIRTGKTTPDKLAIFGGSNSGLLVGAAMTQRPDLFRAVVCMAPVLDMLRYHNFDNAHAWKDEFGTADDPSDFAVLLKYSPYHQVQQGIAYPATMIVSGDADRTCNPLHARKMTARLQAANTSGHPILLDYNIFRGHSPVLPLQDRVEGLTDRMAFLCDQLHLNN